MQYNIYSLQDIIMSYLNSFTFYHPLPIYRHVQSMILLGRLIMKHHRDVGHGDIFYHQGSLQL